MPFAVSNVLFFQNWCPFHSFIYSYKLLFLFLDTSSFTCLKFIQNILTRTYSFIISKITKSLDIFFCKENKRFYYFCFTIYSAFTFQRLSSWRQILMILFIEVFYVIKYQVCDFLVVCARNFDVISN